MRFVSVVSGIRLRMRAQPVVLVPTCCLISSLSFATARLTQASFSEDEAFLIQSILSPLPERAKYLQNISSDLVRESLVEDIEVEDENISVPNYRSPSASVSNAVSSCLNLLSHA